MPERAKSWIWRISSDKRTRDMAGANRPAIWSPEALLDLAGTWDYYEGPSGNTEEKIIREIGEATALHIRIPDDVTSAIYSVWAIFLLGEMCGAKRARTCPLLR